MGLLFIRGQGVTILNHRNDERGGVVAAGFFQRGCDRALRRRADGFRGAGGGGQPRRRPGNGGSSGTAGPGGPTGPPRGSPGPGCAGGALLRAGGPYLVRRRDTPVDLLQQQRYHHFGSQPMERRQAFEQIRLIVSHVVHRELPELSEDTPIAAFGLESTGMLEMLMVLKDSGDVEINADELAPHVFVNVGRLADYITRIAKVQCF